MEDDLKKQEKYKSGMIHFVLTHSYSVVLICLIIGVIFDLFLNINIFNNIKYTYLGLILLFGGSLIVYSSQKSSAFAKKKSIEEGGVFNFSYGLYKYFRHPTYLGLTILVIGFAIIINSPMSVFLSILSYLIIRFIFGKKEERLLELKFGEGYSKYKSKNKI